MQVIDITKYKYISFDVFDTLIFRSVYNPEDIFAMVEEIYKSSYGEVVPSFFQKRIEAEKRARTQHIGKEITFTEIYDLLPYQAEIKDKLQKIEIQVELDNCVPNNSIVKFANYCRSNGKKIIITTDMYLPRQFFERLMNKLGIVPDYIIISAEEKETKRTGKLYPILLKKIKANAKDVLHIGDNPNNDILQARKYGIDSVMRWYEPMGIAINLTARSIVENHIDALTQLYNRAIYDQSAFHIGFSILGPLLYDFCLWLHQQLEINKIDKLLFVAREGYLLSKCYEQLFPEESDKIGYVCLNKNLLRLPLLQATKSLSIYKESLIKRPFYSWSQIFDTFLVSEDLRQRITLAEQIEVDYKVSISREDLLGCKYDTHLSQLMEICEQTILDQSKYLLHYLQQSKFLEGKIGLVNNSINGNGQFMLETYLNNIGFESNIFGLQFIDSKKCQSELKGRYATYFDSIVTTDYQKCEFERNCLIFEHLLFEPTGTSLSFYMRDKVVAVSKKILGKECYNYNFVRKVKQSTLAFIEAYKYHIPLPCKGIGIKRFLNLIHYPSKELAETLCELWDEDIDGEKKLADKSVPLKFNYLFFKNVPKSIIWIEGYLSLKQVPAICFFIIQAKLSAIFYRFHKGSILRDFKIFLRQNNNVKNLHIKR